jgi:serine/threonine protein kinase
MQRVLLVGDEPMPGYKIAEDLGGSAFAKHFKVRTPQGETRLWKVIDLVVGNAAIETRTLGLLVQLRHPNLNTLTNFWNTDEGRTLVVESALPVQSMKDRLAEAKSRGQSGLAPEELIGFMEEAAAALDFLNAPRHQLNNQKVAVYHRALKPSCLLLFREGSGLACKVSDFGLSKPVTEDNAQHSQGLTNYDYDPPEFFEGQTTATSDQFSLACNYYELRTGSLPFAGTMLDQLQGRLNDNPKLTAIQEPERSAVKKALSRQPSSRYESCTAFIAAVKASVGRVAAPAATPAATNVSINGAARPPSVSASMYVGMLNQNGADAGVSTLEPPARPESLTARMESMATARPESVGMVRPDSSGSTGLRPDSAGMSQPDSGSTYRPISPVPNRFPASDAAGNGQGGGHPPGVVFHRPPAGAVPDPASFPKPPSSRPIVPRPESGSLSAGSERPRSTAMPSTVRPGSESGPNVDIRSLRQAIANGSSVGEGTGDGGLSLMSSLAILAGFVVIALAAGFYFL